jgi:glycine oxidase
VRITVVGAGVIGCAVAHELAARGAQVELFDDRLPGMGATQASAVILGPSTDGHSPLLAGLCRSSLAMYDEFIAKVEADSGGPVEYARNGNLHVALAAAHAESLAATAAELAQAGVDHSLLTGAEARAEEPSLAETVVAALLVPSHGYVAALPLTQALAKAAVACGATFTQARVRAVESGASSATVRTDTASIESDAVVVTAGSWATLLLGNNGPDVRPIRGQILRLRSEERLASRVLWGERCYVVPWRDGSMLVGATVEDVGFDERATAAGVGQLLAAACEIVPGLERATFEEVRVGLRPKGPGELPVIGRSLTMPAVVLAVGHHRNGVTLAPLTAALVADFVFNERNRPDLENVTDTITS